MKLYAHAALVPILQSRVADYPDVLAEGGAHDVRNEYCVKVTGEVRTRPEGNANPELPTGDIEVVVSELEVLGESAPLPFQIDERVTVGEEARLKYRYLDLRRPEQGAAIRLRSSPRGWR